MQEGSTASSCNFEDSTLSMYSSVIHSASTGNDTVYGRCYDKNLFSFVTEERINLAKLYWYRFVMGSGKVLKKASINVRYYGILCFEKLKEQNTPERKACKIL